MILWAISSCIINSSRVVSSRRGRSLAASFRGMSMRRSKFISRRAPTTMVPICLFLQDLIETEWSNSPTKTADQSTAKIIWSHERCPRRRTRPLAMPVDKIQFGNSMYKIRRIKVAKTKSSFKSRRTRGRSVVPAMQLR